MKQEQERFLNFVMERIQPGMQDEAKTMMIENFGKQANGTFTAEYLEDFSSRLSGILKPEYVNEVQSAVKEYGQSYAK